MSDLSDGAANLDLNRRRLLAAAGLLTAAGALAEPALAQPAPGAAPTAGLAPPVAGLHLQFGADASSQMTISWHSLQPVTGARVLIGHRDGALKQIAPARTVSYVDAKSGKTVYAHHAQVNGLTPDTDYMYAALHDGAAPKFAGFRTAPRGRARLRFTSFGDQGTPTLGRRLPPAEGSTTPGRWVNDNLGSPEASATTLGVERVAPLFHLFNGDLCYANLAEDRVRTWWDFWSNNSRSAAYRPWMPSPGNHENELGNGAIGYQAYQTYFALPPAEGQTDLTRGLWYAFTAGSVRVIALANDDVCYQDGGDSYVRGYSAGAQKAWLEAELKRARADRNVDWVVVCMHQVAISTAEKFNGADLGIREEWLPLFDRYGVDLVVCGHEHHYERSHPLKGHAETETRTPLAAATATDVIDTTRGCVHMVLGGGGTSLPSHELFTTPPVCRVIVRVEDRDPKTNKRKPVYVTEPAAWSAVRNAGHGYGFAAFEVDPGARPGGPTTMTVTYYDVVGLDGEVKPFESFKLTRPRQD